MSNYYSKCNHKEDYPGCDACRHNVFHVHMDGLCDLPCVYTQDTGKDSMCVPVGDEAVTKKDYIAFAKALHNVISNDSYDERTVAQCTAEIADVLARDNPQFSVKTFIKAVVEGV